LCCLLPSSNRFRPQISAPPVDCSVSRLLELRVSRLRRRSSGFYTARILASVGDLCRPHCDSLAADTWSGSSVGELTAPLVFRFFFRREAAPLLCLETTCSALHSSPSQARQPSPYSSRSTRQRSPEGTLCKSRRPRFPWSASICPKENLGVRLQFHKRLS
jgi:hypothetical protein